MFNFLSSTNSVTSNHLLEHPVCPHIPFFFSLFLLLFSTFLFNSYVLILFHHKSPSPLLRFLYTTFLFSTSASPLPHSVSFLLFFSRPPFLHNSISPFSFIPPPPSFVTLPSWRNCFTSTHFLVSLYPFLLSFPTPLVTYLPIPLVLILISPSLSSYSSPSLFNSYILISFLYYSPSLLLWSFYTLSFFSSFLFFTFASSLPHSVSFSIHFFSPLSFTTPHPSLVKRPFFHTLFHLFSFPCRSRLSSYSSLFLSLPSSILIYSNFLTELHFASVSPSLPQYLSPPYPHFPISFLFLRHFTSPLRFIPALPSFVQLTFFQKLLHLYSFPRAFCLSSFFFLLLSFLTNL